MKLKDYLQSSSEYLVGCLKKDKQPLLKDNEIIADLHAHTDIFSIDDLYETLDSMVEHKVDLLAMTHRIYDCKNELSYDQVKRQIKNELDYKDLGRAFKVTHKGKELTLVGAYEVEFYINKSSRYLNHMIVLMPDRGFDRYTKELKSLEYFTTLGREYNAILLGAHPYSVKNSQARSKLSRYMVAPVEFHSSIEKNIFHAVDGVDCTASNVGWMKHSNNLLNERYNPKPLWTSDATMKSDFGRAGTIFKLKDYKNGSELRNRLRNLIVTGQFRTYSGYKPPTSALSYFFNDLGTPNRNKQAKI